MTVRSVSGRSAWVVPTVLVLAGCAALPPPLTDATASCRAFFDQMDAQVERAGLRDGGDAAVAGYPYLRVDRFLASFAGEVDGDAAFADWVRRMRAQDLQARTIELQRLDPSAAPARVQRVRQCGEQLAGLELQSAAQKARLRAHVRTPDEYAFGARGLGLYPLAVPFLNLGIDRYHDEVRSDYAVPLDALDSPGPLALWVPSPDATPPQAAMALDTVPRDALGIPQLDAEAVRALAIRFAPAWWIETGGDFDRPGWPVQRASGPTVDPARPVVHYRLDYTRFGARILPALSYVIWFSERPRQSSLDPYSGRLDGLIWRVVLDPSGRPLSYDTIHSCGCYRYVFPAQPLRRSGRGGFWQESVLYPQDDLPGAPLALRVQSKTHYVRRVVSAAQAAGERQFYELRPYEDLLLRSGTAPPLFGRDGLVDGSERLERWWLWITGVPDPGAMRQWGRHATSFVGRSHFDDARFLEQQYEVPDWAR